MLYKYRGLNNLSFFEDIIKNNRLYAATFNELNDPFEGHYTYSKGIISDEIIEEIKHEKIKLGIVSLSRNWDNIKMWSHYADSHKGVVICVELDSKKYMVKEVKYIDELYELDIDYEKKTSFLSTKERQDISIEILSHKLTQWDEEKEERVFNKSSIKYISVNIREIILGYRMSAEDKYKIKELVKKYNPKINITEIINEHGKLNKKQYYDKKVDLNSPNSFV